MSVLELQKKVFEEKLLAEVALAAPSPSEVCYQLHEMLPLYSHLRCFGLLNTYLEPSTCLELLRILTGKATLRILQFENVPVPEAGARLLAECLRKEEPPLEELWLLDLAASLPDCPASWLDRASSRAWKAGAWARLVLQGAIGTPAASRQLNIPSRYYAVIGGEGVHPALYRSYRDYSRALGPIEASSAVSHAFPTELETQVYCAGAQVAAGLVAPMEDMVGPSTVVTCDAAYLVEGVLDVSAEALLRLTPMEPDEPPELLITFDSGSPNLLPEPHSLVTAAQAWTMDPAAAALERVTFYRADEAPAPAGETGKKPRPKLHLTRADLEASAPKPTTNATEPPAKPKRPSMAGLAAQMETLMGAKPAGVNRGCGSAEEGAQEAEDVEVDPPAQNPLAQAMLAQSQALTSLVQQLAASSADPVLDLGAAGSVGVRGASQRAHFQEELAQGKGVFFRQVLQNLGRRMAPSQVVAGSPEAMLEQGLTLSRYWERFGGWANARDMALVAYQVGLIFDAMMGERYDLAKDHLALLAVSLEQSALDGSRMDIGFQLTWLEELPSSMFMSLPQLQPYRALDVSRLRLHGKGDWKLESFLEGPLWLPFLDPAILRHGFAVAPEDLPDLDQESFEECLKLALLWDANHLLDLRWPLLREAAFARSCRIFNSYKNEELDRQIGDRRPANRSEYHLAGPSKWLPQGHLVAAYSLERYREKLCGFASDRKDFYHQIGASAQRADSNRLPFSYPLSCFANTHALLSLCSSAKAGSGRPRPLLQSPGGPTAACAPPAKSCPAPRDRHASASSNPGCGPLGGPEPEARPDGAGKPKDFSLEGPFVAHRDSASASSNPGCGPFPTGCCADTQVTPAFKSMLQGDHHGVEFALEGHRQLLSAYGAIAPHCELRGGDAPPLSRLWQAVVIDDLVNLSPVSVSSPSATKSEGQAMHSRAQVAYSSEAILGAPEKDVVGEQLFKAIGAEIDSRDPQVARGCVPVAAPLSRRVPLAALSLRAAVLPVTTPRLLSRLSGAWVSVALFRRCTMALFGKVFGEESRASATSSSSAAVEQPRLLAQELCLAAALMPLMASDITAPFCNKVYATDASLGLGAFCSTEVAGYSRLSTGATSLLEALGVETTAEEGRDEETFAVPSAGLPFRLDLIEVGLPAPFVSAEAAALGLQVGPPFHPKCSPFFRLADPDLLVWFYSVLKAGYVKALVLHSPAVAGRSPRNPHSTTRGAGSSFAGARYLRRCQVFARRCRFLFAAAARFGRPALLLEKDTGGGPVSLPATAPAACRFTVAACAFGCPSCCAWHALSVGLDSAPLQRRCPCPTAHRAAAFLGLPDRPLELPAGFAWCAAKVLASAIRQPVPRDTASRLESLVCNDLLSAARWEVECVIPWRTPHHINVLELSTLGALLRRLAIQACVVQLAYGLYASLGLASTLLMLLAAARCVSWHHGLFSSLSQLAYFEAGAPTLGPSTFGPLSFSCAQCFCKLFLALCWALCLSVTAAAPFAPLGFDSSLGFPGEGWAGLFLWGVLFRVCLCAAMDQAAPRTPADALRAEARRPLHLVADRVIRPATRSNRARLLDEFDSWLQAHQGCSLADLLGLPYDQAERIAMILVLYGQQLFRSGSPYYRYSETINGVGAARPGIRRSLGAAWDLAFAWLTEEPHAHHRALPRGVLLALVSAALCWGWLREAGVFMLAWTGLLRIGEVVSATRRDLILPSDASPGTTFALLQIRAPKTRGRAAKHQASHVDPPDAVQLLELAFGHLQPAARLWPMSSGALRRRFRLLQSRFGLVHNDGSPHFDLSSFRPGGATWMLHCTENPDLVRRRGRWLSLRVMEIYLQEVEAITYLPSLSVEQRDFLKLMTESFPVLLRKASFFQSAKIPTAAWFFLLFDPKS
ncbi:unnamed protein product [Symbiodinium microadriaticum]|nr:unnamed protein product [Symbiodinium microadriaticum]